MSRRSNAARWILAFQALVFLMLGGLEVWAFPKEVCPFMAASRSLAEEAISCPEYVGEHPIFEMYTFSLGKHLTMIGAVFVYFAIAGRSKAAIQLGLLYPPVALLIDLIPPWTWFSTSGVGTSLFPPLFWLAMISCALSCAGLVLNARHGEWAADPPSTKLKARMIGAMS